MESDRGHGQVVSAQLDIGASSGLAYRIGESPVPSRLSQVGWLESGARRGACPDHAASFVTYAKMADLFQSPSKQAPGRQSGYSAKDIQVLEGLEPVRRRPGMYLGGTAQRPMTHPVAAVMDNSKDEQRA